MAREGELALCVVARVGLAPLDRRLAADLPRSQPISRARRARAWRAAPDQAPRGKLLNLLDRPASIMASKRASMRR